MSRSISRRGALITFYAGGALLCAMSLIPGWLSQGTTVIAAVGALAALGTACAGLLRRLSVVVAQVLVAAGGALVAGVVFGAGGGIPSAAFAVYGLFIAIYAALFFRTGAFLAHTCGCLTLVTFALARTATDSGDVAHFTMFLGGTMLATGTVLRLLVRRVTELSTHDLLTGLHNEAGLRAVAADFSAQAAPGDTTVVLLVDVDRFAEVNDALGRDAGDELLRAIGRDLMGRYAVPAPWGPAAAQVAVGGSVRTCSPWS